MVDPKIVQLDNLEYASTACVYFQRTTVILGELLLGFALYKYLKAYNESKNFALSFLFIFLQHSYIIVDHIHFQYNTFMQGILILSVYYMRKEKHLISALLFAVLLNFKHIYIYFAPVYFFFLLRGYCIRGKKFNVANFIKLALTVLTVFLISFAPFLDPKQITQILSRLFPWQRGLVHALWAPNFWALYCFLDRVLAFAAKKFFKMDIALPEKSPTKGVVGEIDMAVLPQITSGICIIIILLFLTPLIRKIWKEHNSKDFVRYCLYSGMTFFMFGYHVHEKAIIPQLTFLQLIAAESIEYSNLALFISFNAGASMFPLLYQLDETMTQVVLILVYHIGYFIFLELNKKFAKENVKTSSKYDYVEKLFFFLIGLVLPVFNLLVYPRMKGFERLNWILLWVLTALGNVYVYWRSFPRKHLKVEEKRV